MSTAMKKSLRIAVIILCIFGAGLSAVSLRSHYATDATRYCALNATFNCDVVNRSAYSQFLGVPVALIGLGGYMLLLWLALRSDHYSGILRTGASWVGFGFALYLTYIEDRVLMTWCLLCIGSLLAISGITAIYSCDFVHRCRKGACGIGIHRIRASRNGGPADN